MNAMGSSAEKFLALIEIVRRLRAPDGCPWDQKQTPQTFKHYLIEETHELIEAINDDDPDHIREEMGDLLFQIVFLGALYQEKGFFTLAEAIDSIREKMIRRHPHVFGEAVAGSEHELRRQWQAIKNEENKGKKQPVHPLASIPKSLPALRRSQRLADRAAREGFAWTNIAGALGKAGEELQELSAAIAAGERRHIREELGDLLFSLTVVARHAEVDGEEALHTAADKFIRRFLAMEEIAAEHEQKLAGLDQDKLLALWRQGKNRAGSTPETDEND